MLGHLLDAVVPSGFATALFLAGLVAALAHRTRSLACPLVTGAAIVLIVFSNGLVASLLSSPLEYSYPALRDQQHHPDAKFIAVLTAYAADDPDMSLSGRLNASAAFRVLEAANLWAARPDCVVVVSGAATAADIMARQLRSLGIPDRSLLVDGDSDSTAESAVYLSRLAGDRSLFLVTSAGHMRRAVGVFRKRGMDPIPAPTDYQLPRLARHASWTTSATHLQASDFAVHEYVAIAWYRLTNRI
jgi:uncharacterized SAM-binding protein YcdF (DUF218 family)